MALSQPPRLLAPIVADEADYPRANRLLNAESRAEMPSFRLFGNTVVTFLTANARGYWKTVDPQNGYTAISTEALDAVGIARSYEYYGTCNDLLVTLNVPGLRVAAVALPARDGEAASSSSYPLDIRTGSGMLLRNFRW